MTDTTLLRVSQVLAVSSLATVLSNPALAFDVKRGLMSAAPVGIVTNDPGTGAAHTLVVREAGASPGVPAEWSATTFGPASSQHPDYSMAALRARAGWTDVEFAAISTGSDITPAVDPQGRLGINSGTPVWYGLTIAVDEHTAGAPGSLLATQAQHGGRFYTYYAKDSGGIAQAYAGTAMVEQLPSQSGLTNNAPVNGLDWGIGSNAEGGYVTAGTMFPFTGKFYFAVTKSWANANGSLWLEVPNAQPQSFEQINPATIYSMTWQQVGGVWEWSAPVIEATCTELGLEPGIDEIDALTFYTRNDRETIVLSTNPYATGAAALDRDEILVFQRQGTRASGYTTTTALQPLADNDGTAISSRYGLRRRSQLPVNSLPNNVTAGCGHDPEAWTYSKFAGTPSYKSAAGGQQHELGISVIRSFQLDAAGLPVDDTLHMELAGFDLSGLQAAAVEFLVGPADAPVGGTMPMPPGFLSLPPVYFPPAPGKDSVGITMPGNLARPDGVTWTHVHVKAVLYGLAVGASQPHIVGSSHVSVIHYW